jgi:hypothetical protein
MASPAQIAANRANATKSTGPRTEDGKAASRNNALKHGIDAHASVLPGEDPDELEALAEYYRERFRPCSAEQDHLVNTMIRADWNGRRYARIQAELTVRLLGEMDPADQSLAALFMPDNPAARALNRVIRYAEAAERTWFRALNEMSRIQLRDAQMSPALTIASSPENWLRSTTRGSGFLPAAAPPLQTTPNPSVPSPAQRPAASNPDRDRNLALRL